MSLFDKVCKWLKKYGGFFIGGILVILGTGWIYQRRVTLNVRDDLKVQRVKTKVAELQSVSNRLEEMNEEDEVIIAEIESQREEIKQEIEEAHEVSGMTDEEVLSAFADLGYH
jgi:hypothetical protein